MGGGRAGDYFPKSSEELRKLLEVSRRAEQQKYLDSDVNQLLQEYLIRFNQRDATKTQEYLEDLGRVLGEEASIDRFLLGGSVAKHTYVDGLSDIDALVVLNRSDLEGKGPKEVLREFSELLKNRLTADVVESIRLGNMAVTVTYRDKTEIQLLPALRKGNVIAVPDSGGAQWRETNPREFQRTLALMNERQNNLLIPVIKLVKAVSDSLPEGSRLKGYHVEALSLEAAKGYEGERSLKALLLHILEASSRRVLQPIADVTGQSRFVDSDMGGSNSAARQRVASSLRKVARQLGTAMSIDEWKSRLEG